MSGIKHSFVKTNGIKMHVARLETASRSCFATAFLRCGTRGGIR